MGWKLRIILPIDVSKLVNVNESFVTYYSDFILFQLNYDIFYFICQRLGWKSRCNEKLFDFFLFLSWYSDYFEQERWIPLIYLYSNIHQLPKQLRLFLSWMAWPSKVWCGYIWPTNRCIPFHLILKMKISFVLLLCPTSHFHLSLANFVRQFNFRIAVGFFQNFNWFASF